jgi:two-component system sensor histidine kinase HydH
MNASDVSGMLAEKVLPLPCRILLQNLQLNKILVEKEIDCPVKDGKIAPLEIIATALKDGAGDSFSYIILFRDLTEVVHLKKEIETSRRLAAIGNLAAGVAHEIRNPLSSIKGFATYFKERLQDIPEDGKIADIMIQETERLNRVVSRLLDFARPLKMEMRLFSLHLLIRDTLKIIAGQAKEKNIAIEAALPTHNFEALIDSDRMRQALLNLCINAVEAMNKGGVLSVSLSTMENGKYRVDVSDTGCGIGTDDIPRIFDPYFTTKSSGTGLGLAISHKIIEAHKGEITVKSEEGKGTTVSIILPVVAEGKDGLKTDNTRPATSQKGNKRPSDDVFFKG